jgi:hypothetical protein
MRRTVQMQFDNSLGDRAATGDLQIAQAPAGELEHLKLTSGQPKPAVARAWKHVLDSRALLRRRHPRPLLPLQRSADDAERTSFAQALGKVCLCAGPQHFGSECVVQCGGKRDERRRRVEISEPGDYRKCGRLRQAIELH